MILSCVQALARTPESQDLLTMVGTMRRERLSHLIVLNEKGLRKILNEYVRYYNEHRCHPSLDGNAPQPRKLDPPGNGRLLATPILGGLHHTYHRAG